MNPFRPKLRRILLSLLVLIVIVYLVFHSSPTAPPSPPPQSPESAEPDSVDYYDYGGDETSKRKERLELDPTLYKIGIALQEIHKLNGNEFPNDIKPKTIAIVSTWRSGSTFFADAVSSHPAIFYHYEPWTGYKTAKLREPGSQDLNKALQMFNSLRKCSYADLYEYLELAEVDGAMLKQNDKIRRACEFLATDCYLADFLEPACEYFPVQLFKFVKAEIQDFATLMDDPGLYLILLLRDPRAIYASRSQLQWCLQDPTCSNITGMCTLLNRNFNQAQALRTKYPDRTFIVGYEDLASSPMQLAKVLFQNLDLPWHRRIEWFIADHTSKDVDEPWSTFRKGSERIDRWKTVLNESVVAEIDFECQDFLSSYYSKAIKTESSSTS